MSGRGSGAPKTQPRVQARLVEERLHAPGRVRGHADAERATRAVRLVKALDQLDDGRLAATGRANECHLQAKIAMHER